MDKKQMMSEMIALENRQKDILYIECSVCKNSFMKYFLSYFSDGKTITPVCYVCREDTNGKQDWWLQSRDIKTVRRALGKMAKMGTILKWGGKMNKIDDGGVEQYEIQLAIFTMCKFLDQYHLNKLIQDLYILDGAITEKRRRT